MSAATDTTNAITEADTVIIGSGVAATALAGKLLDADPSASIMMLEAGAQVKMRDFALYQHYLVTGGLPYSNYYDLAPPTRGKSGENRFTGNTEMSLQGSRLMMYGGSTVHWDGYSFRFKPEDFHLYTNTGRGIDWPLTYDELEPYYCEAEAHLGVSGDSNDTSVPRSQRYPFRAFPYTLEDSLAIEAFDQIGLEYSHLPIARHGITDTTSSMAPCQTTGTCLYCPFGARYNAANVLDDLQRLHDHPNFAVRLNAVVETVLMDSKAHARGVTYVDRATGAHVVVEARNIVIASGTIESPKLLLRSVSSFWEHGIGNDHDLVGRNVVTHPWITFETELSANPRHLQPEMAFPTLVSRHFDSVAEQPRGKFVLINPPSTPTINLALAMQHGHTRSEIDDIVSGRTTMQFNAMFEVFSEPTYRVSNLDRTSHLGMVESVVHFDVDDLINSRMKDVEAHATEVFRAMGATGEVRTDASWGAHHATCTTRMSSSPELGVVDVDTRVHGVDNLYVCSNASFSTLSAVNPTLTLVALAVRLGDHLTGARGTGARGTGRTGKVTP